MDTVFILGVPPADQEDLLTLATELQATPEFAEHKYFDGAAFVEIVLPIVFTAQAWRTLRTWIQTRGEVAKATRVTTSDFEITGMTPDQAERIIAVLSEHVTVENVDGD